MHQALKSDPRFNCLKFEFDIRQSARLRLLRRRVIAGLIGAAIWLRASKAQQSGRMAARVGLLLAGPSSGTDAWMEAFRQGLSDEGLQPDTDIDLVVGAPRPDSDIDVAAAAIAESGAAVLVGASLREVRALMRASAGRPVVMVAVGDPVGAGLVASLERPGGSVTGLSDFRPDFADQRLRLLRELLPSLRRVGFLFNPDAPTAPVTVDAAQRLGIELLPLKARTQSEISDVLSAAAAMDALLVVPYPASLRERWHIGEWAANRALPVLFGYADFMDLPKEIAGIASLGVNLSELYRRAASYVVAILRGTKPGELPIGRPQKAQLIVNLAVARRLRIEIPASVLRRADSIIEG